MASQRQAARVVLLDRQKRVYLIHSGDPGDPEKGDWWEIPGGGMFPGEPSGDAAARELWEEAGVRDAEMGPVIRTQHVTYEFAGMWFDQDEYIHVAWCEDQVDNQPQGLEFFEAMAFRGARWWPVDELAASDIKTIPYRLKEFVAPIAAGDIPTEPINIEPEGAPPF